MLIPLEVKSPVSRFGLWESFYHVSNDLTQYTLAMDRQNEKLGADTGLTEQFVKMGIDELSVAPGNILPIRKIIRDMK